MKRLLREPLLHFLLIGAVLFGVHAVMPADLAAPATSKEIRLTLDELARIALVFQSQWRREPTPQEFQRMVEDQVRSEILYREALAMGLDKDDEIVKRRLAQKMQFLAEDAGAAREPDRALLEAWFAKNASAFSQPARVSFRHLYFSPDTRGERARDDAAAALAKLAGQPQDAKLASALADRFMLQDYYRDRASDYLGKELGPQFALAVAKLPPGSWQGPLQSGFGWHLVFVDTLIPGNVPAFDEVESDVRTAWLREQKALAWQQAYDQMRAKYTVLLPAPPEVGSRQAANASEAPPAVPR